MKFTLASCLFALAAVAVAKPKFTNSNFNVVAGQPFTLTWTNAKGPVTITLKTGNPPNGLKTYETLATGVTGTSQTVTLKKDIPSGQYAFTVADGPTEDDTNYSVPFALQGTSASITDSSTSTASTTSPVTSSANTTSSSSSSMTTMTSSRNSTSSTSSSSASSTATRSTPSASTPTGSTPTGVPNNNSGGKVQSSLALVLLGAAAYVFLN